jgi:hypothetical protein
MPDRLHGGATLVHDGLMGAADEIRVKILGCGARRR